MAAGQSSASQDVLSAISSVDGEKPDYNAYSLESLILLINSERLHTLEAQVHKEFQELKPRQDQVVFLHKLLKAINSSTDDKGAVDWTGNDELIELLDKAREMGVDIPEDKKKFKSSERERLIDNIKMTVEDLNIQNDMQLQNITRLNNERYESYQLARAIMKPLHDTKVQQARAMVR